MTMPRLFCLWAALLLVPALAAPALAGRSMPATAAELGSSLDAQLVERLQLPEGPAKGTTLILTTPVSLEDLDQSAPVARLMGEELAAWFVAAGYRVQEIRRGKHILFEPGQGEMLLTRDVQMLNEKFQRSAVILTATYAMTTRSVRFSVRLLHAPTGEVLAMSNKTLELTRETTEMVGPERFQEMTRVRPSVGTRLTAERPKVLLEPWRRF